MTYKTYDEYKSSNNNSIGDIPSHWEFHKLKNVVFFQEGPGLRNWQFTDGGIKVICVSNITEKGIDFSNYQRYISEKEYKETYKHFTVNKGDLLLSSSGSIGKVSEYLSDETVILNTSTIRINTHNKPDFVDLQFVKWALKSESIKEQLKLLMTGAVQFNFGPSHLSKVILAHPHSKEEQHQITNYLDKQTAKIDATIAKNEELIQLLEEKRVALINEVVTKGLNPDVAMKDSGVEWIGEIPENWDVTLARRFCKIETGGTPKREVLSYWENGTVNWMTSGEVNQEYVNDTKNKITVEGLNNSNAHTLPRHSIVMALSGQGQTKGRVAVLNIPTCCSQSVGAFICDNIHVYYKYLFYYFKSRYYDIRGLVGDNLRDGLSLSIIGNIPTLLPPFDEQVSIANELDDHIPKINKTINKIQKNIALLEEYKTSLIHHVVTGKIDVRGEEI